MQKKEEDHLVSYTWKQFECEICKKPYPYIFKSNGRKYRLVDVDVPEQKNFLWLESLTFEKNSCRMVHLIMPNEQLSQFKLGRGHESDVRVSDISVSRCHAILKYDSSDNGYYLEDNLSKFGTLVLAK
jgi:FHA domain